VFAGGVSASAQTDLPKNVIQLAQLKRNVHEQLAALPNYTCVETIGRWRRENASRPFRYLDTVRLEVQVVNNRELYSWPGANRFEDRGIGEIVGSGTVSTGSFATEAHTVFLSNTSTITWHGEEERLGRHTARWDYSIPYNLSGWTIQLSGRSGRVSEIGSFWADAGSLDLLRLESNADQIPPDLDVASVHDTFDYARVRIGSRNLLLPQSVEIVLTDLGGQQDRNIIEFSHCREFSAQASVTFDAAPRIDQPDSPPAEISIRAGLSFAVRLAHAIDSRTAAVGDELSAQVESDIKDKGVVVVPKGAVLRGRIRRLERHAASRNFYIVGLEFTDIEFPGHHALFFGDMISADPVAGLQSSFGSSKSRTSDYGLGGSLTTSETESYWTVPIPGVSTFFIEGASFRLPEGLHMVWHTVKLAK